MTAKSDHLAELRQAFARRWRPHDDADIRYRDDFEIALDRLIYAAFAAAQEPFVRELEMHRDLAMKTAFLSPSGKAL